MFDKIRVGAAEMPVSEEAVVGRERRRVGGCQYKVFVSVYELPFSLCVAAPQNEYQVLALFGK
jgi:hypothetical protein